MASSACLKCGQIINLGSDPQIGQIFRCISCRAEFELVWLNPLELDWTFEDTEDDDPWDEGFDFKPDFEGHDKYDGWDGV